ncbi:MAG TPA: VCBS repeat-containing protein [Acidimicrobiales bacterium]|nr:VCBS repeat-containing protein [Acidimicrobiales bacterium]
MNHRPRLALLTVLALITPATLLASSSTAGASHSQTFSAVLPYMTKISSPVIADVDGDGVNDIITVGYEGVLRVLNVNGGAIPGWSGGRGIQVRPGINSPTDATPAVADLDNDGAMEIIVAAGTIDPDGASKPGGVVVFDRSGNLRFRWEGMDTINVATGGSPDGVPDGFWSSPSIGDVDGDGYQDIIAAGLDQRIYAFDYRRSALISGFPFWSKDTVFSTASLYDVDGDRREEIFIGGDESAYPGTTKINGGLFRRLDWEAGRVVVAWERKFGEIIASSPAVGNITGDSTPEVVFGSGDFWNRRGGDINASRSVWGLNPHNGADVFTMTVDGTTNTSPALGDLDGDGYEDIVFGSYAGKAYAFRGDRRLLWQRDIGSIGFNTSPIIADLDGNGSNDVAIGSQNGIRTLRGSDGIEMHRIQEGYSFINAPAVGSFPGGWRLIGLGHRLSPREGLLTINAMPTPGKVPFPMFKRTADHRGHTLPRPVPLAPGYCSSGSNPPTNPSSASARGYWVLGGDGGVFAFDAPFHGSTPGLGITTDVVGMKPTKTGDGYWVVGRDGGIFSFGSARFHGSMGGKPLNAPIIGMEPTVTGNGYWLLAADGGIFSFGDARFYGSMGAQRLNAPVIAMSRTAGGGGYWLLASDGGVFTFGDAAFHGSTGGMRLNSPVKSMTTDPLGRGYWLLGGDGGVFSFNVPFFGSLPGTGLCTPPASIQIRASLTGRGYWVLGGDGGVFSFGDALFHGARPGLSGRGAPVDLEIAP